MQLTVHPHGCDDKSGGGKQVYYKSWPNGTTYLLNHRWLNYIYYSFFFTVYTLSIYLYVHDKQYCILYWSLILQSQPVGKLFNYNDSWHKWNATFTWPTQWVKHNYNYNYKVCWSLTDYTGWCYIIINDLLRGRQSFLITC